MSSLPPPERTELTAPYWEALDRGELVFQRCSECGSAWLPARTECPRCLAPEWGWEKASGGGRLVSWVVYHRSYHPAFADRLPYNVAVVELDEGPRLISNITGVQGGEGLEADMRLHLHVERDAGVPLARFEIAQGSAPAAGGAT
jgi:uncharacterized OB-fold protein